MLAEDTPTIRAVSPRTGMRKGGYAEHEAGHFAQITAAAEASA
jgi:hypothetical protein